MIVRNRRKSSGDQSGTQLQKWAPSTPNGFGMTFITRNFLRGRVGLMPQKISLPLVTALPATEAATAALLAGPPKTPPPPPATGYHPSATVQEQLHQLQK
jgi:hypothetical protein